jgi:hypothetical protein
MRWRTLGRLAATVVVGLVAAGLVGAVGIAGARAEVYTARGPGAPSAPVNAAGAAWPVPRRRPGGGGGHDHARRRFAAGCCAAWFATIWRWSWPWSQAQKTERDGKGGQGGNDATAPRP